MSGHGPDATRPGQDPVMNFSEHGNGLSDSVKGWGFLDHLRDCQLLK